MQINHLTENTWIITTRNMCHIFFVCVYNIAYNVNTNNTFNMITLSNKNTWIITQEICTKFTNAFFAVHVSIANAATLIVFVQSFEYRCDSCYWFVCTAQNNDAPIRLICLPKKGRCFMQSFSQIFDLNSKPTSFFSIRSDMKWH